jgi:hypothetical protein
MSEHSDLDRQIEQLKRCEIIKESEVKVLCAKAREILIEESNVQRIDSPVVVSFVVCAKSIVHHQTFFFLRCVETFTASSTISRSSSKSGVMFRKPTTCEFFYWISFNLTDNDGDCFRFMGDFVDRGYYSVETFLLLLALKVTFASLNCLRLKCFHLGSIPRSHHTHSWQSRVASNHTSLRLLRRMPAKVWIHHRLAVLHRSLRLSKPLGHHRWKDLLCSRRPQPLNSVFGSNSLDRSQAGSSS